MQMEIDLQNIHRINFEIDMEDAFGTDVVLPPCDECGSKARWEISLMEGKIKSRIVYLCDTHKERMKEGYNDEN